MNLATIPLHADPEGRPSLHLVGAPAPAVRVTAHACLRYAQRVLGLELGEAELGRDRALRGRCERGIMRLMERAECARKGDDVEVWVARTRALIVKDARVLTVLVARSSRGFGKRIFRKAGV